MFWGSLLYSFSRYNEQLWAEHSFKMLINFQTTHHSQEYGMLLYQGSKPHSHISKGKPDACSAKE